MTQLPRSLGPLQQSADFPLAFRVLQPQPLQPTSCVVLLHGVGGSEVNLGELAAGIDPDTLVVLARGPLQIGFGQFAWFRVAFTPTGPSIVESEAEQARQLLIQFVEQLQAAYGIEPQRTVVAGFSQGGIMSASVALSAPERVAGFGVLSGRILPELAPHMAAPERLGQLAAFIGHGEYDSKLPVAWAHRSDELLNSLGVRHSVHLYPIDHAINASMQSEFLHWLAPLVAVEVNATPA
jgi:phospholipase/carboxylesterase